MATALLCRADVITCFLIRGSCCCRQCVFRSQVPALPLRRQRCCLPSRFPCARQCAKRSVCVWSPPPKVSTSQPLQPVTMLGCMAKVAWNEGCAWINLRGKVILGYPSGLSVITRILHVQEGGEESEPERGWNTLCCWLKEGRRGHKPRFVSGLGRLEKSRKRFSRRTSGRNTALPTLDPSPVRSILFF